MQIRTVKYLTKQELLEANRQAIDADRQAIDPIYARQLSEGLRYPVIFTLPWDEDGWVRCQIGTATTVLAHDYTPVVMDVPQAIYNTLSSAEIEEKEEVTQ